MASGINEYYNLKLLEASRTAARRAWVFLLILSAAWCLLIFAPAIAAAADVQILSTRLYSFFGYICHQIPSRSFHVLGHKLGVCSRCFGVYSGLVLGVAVYPLFRKIADTNPLPRVWLILAMFPIGLDWALTYFGIWENTFFTRFTSGLILGAACAVYIIPASSELALAYQSKRKRFSQDP